MQLLHITEDHHLEEIIKEHQRVEVHLAAQHIQNHQHPLQCVKVIRQVVQAEDHHQLVVEEAVAEE